MKAVAKDVDGSAGVDPVTALPRDEALRVWYERTWPDVYRLIYRHVKNHLRRRCWPGAGIRMTPPTACGSRVSLTMDLFMDYIRSYYEKGG